MSHKTAFGIAALRAAVQKRSDETSLRLTADEIGMSYTGLRHFLAGGKPHPRTREMLVEWYAKGRSLRVVEDVTKDDAEAAMTLLVSYIAANGRTALSAKRRAAVADRLFGSDAVVNPED